MFVDRETRERREAWAAEQWRLARKTLKRTTQVVIVLGLVVLGLLLYLYFTLPESFPLTPAEQQALRARTSR